MCPGLSYIRAISGSFILLSTENKLLNLPAKKGFAIHHAAYSWDEWRTQISVTACLGFLMMIYFHFQGSKTHILSLLFLLHCFLMLVSIKTFLLLLACCCLVTLSPPTPVSIPDQISTKLRFVEDSLRLCQKPFLWEMGIIRCHSIPCFR